MNVRKPEELAQPSDVDSSSRPAPTPAAQDRRQPAGVRQRTGAVSRLLLCVAAAALAVSPCFPYWKMKLSAPQYPKGLYLTVYPHSVTGDVREIDGLNHYIGLRKIADAAAAERRLGTPAILLIAACLVAAALWRSRWAVLLAVPAILFPPLFFADLYFWLRDSGLHLDPKAALSSSIKPFVPQVFGHGKIAQFKTDATLDVGFYLSVFAAGSGLFFSYARLRRPRLAQPVLASTQAEPAFLVLGTALGLGMLAPGVLADTLVVRPEVPALTIADAVEKAAPGDTIVVRGGVHPGPLVVRKPVRLLGEGRPVIDGRGHGSVVRLEAPGVELDGFVVRSSGDVLEREDVGVLVTAADVRVVGNSLEDVLFGVYLRQAPRCVVRGNRLHGKNLPVPRRGDLIRLWYSDDAIIADNTTSGGRDVVLWYSNHLTIRDNHVSQGRYGLHFMYCHDATVAGNRLRDNSVGAFLMYSQRLLLRQNWIASNRGPSGYAIGLKDMVDYQVSANVLVGNKVGVFLENARGGLDGNLVIDNDRAIVIFPSAQGNRFLDNSFRDNGEQVAIQGYSATMSTNLWQGNFWSDYRGYDRDGDGDGDIPYRPMRLFERLSDRQPTLKLFAENPAAQAIDFAARALPIFEPRPTIVDQRPRMRPMAAPFPIAVRGADWHWLALGTVLLAGPMALALIGPFGMGARFVRGGAQPRAAALAATPANATPATVPSGHSPAAISVHGLTKQFGKLIAVDDLSFDVRQGEAVALWGPNGAGKTTVVRCLLGLLPCQGTLRVLGCPCGPGGRESRRLIGYVPQEVRLHVDQSVRDTVCFYARLRKVTLARADKLIREWGLMAFERRPVRHLSGGMKQKLALVIALLSDPPVLLLDEPTSNLDARTRREFGDLLEALKSAGKTLLFCTHRASEVWRLADRVIVLDQGRQVGGGPPERVRDHISAPAQLCLTVPVAESAFAAALLRDSGFEVRGSGSRLWVDAPAGRKVKAIALLGNAGVRVLDLDIENDGQHTEAAPEG
jgi:nitrous oxidase accessory protein